MGAGGVLSGQAEVGSGKEMRLLHLSQPGVQSRLGGILGKPRHPPRSCHSLGQEHFPQHPTAPADPLCAPPHPPAHYVASGLPTLSFHLILEILTPGMGLMLSIPSPDQSWSPPTPALAARVPARDSHHSPLAFKGLLCEREYVATSARRLRHAEALLTAAPHQQDQTGGRERRGGGSPPRLNNLNCVRKRR